MLNDPFYASVDAWVTKVREREDRVVQLSAQLALQRIKELTPVKTGNLRASWILLRGSQAELLSGGELRVADSQTSVLSLRAGDAWTIANPAPYARRINYGFVGTDSLGRHYDQPGVHMLEKVITELPDIVARASAIVASGG